MKIYLERFWAKVKKTKTCWIWTAAKSDLGYGTAWFCKKRIPAHRLSYEIHKGKIPKGLHIDHLCRNPSCVKPEHLEAVPPRINCLRGIGPSAIHARKTKCINGHKFVGNNFLINKSGSRVCLKCRKYKTEKISKLLGHIPVRTHCNRGHEYTSQNTKIRKDGYRICITCHRLTANKPPHKDRSKCKNGHTFTDETTYMNPRGIKECQVCRRARAEKRYEKILKIKHLI